MEINNKHNIGDRIFVTNGTQINSCKVNAIKVYKDMLAYEVEYLKHPTIPNKTLPESLIFKSIEDTKNYLVSVIIADIILD